MSSLTRLGQRKIEPLAKLGDACLGFLVFLFGGVERLLDRGELPAQRGNLLVEHFDLCQSARGDLLFALELAGKLRRLALRCRGTSARTVGGTL